MSSYREPLGVVVAGFLRGLPWAFARPLALRRDGQERVGDQPHLNFGRLALGGPHGQVQPPGRGDRGTPAEFPLGGVIPCWTEGVQKMKVGGKARLTCPPGIAYGNRAVGGVIPANSTLVFEIELLDVRK